MRAQIGSIRKVTLLGASFNNENLGVGALAGGSVASILEAAPTAEVSLLVYGRTAERQVVRWRGGRVVVHTVHLRKKPDRTHNLFLLLGLALICRLMGTGNGVRRWLVARNRVLTQLVETDVACSIAGGDSFSDTYGLRVLVDVCLPQLLVRLMGIRLIQLPQTLGPFRSWVARRLAARVLGASEWIFSRDDESVEAVRRLDCGAALASKTEFCHDVGFLVEPEPADGVEVAELTLAAGTGPLVGLNVSGLLHMGGFRGDDAFGCQAAYRELTERTLQLFLEELGVRVLLVPHVHGERPSSDPGISEALFAEWAHRYPGRVGVTRGRYTTGAIKSVIGQCDLFVGARMHACIGALSMCVPAVPVAYSRKFRGVFESLGIGDLVVDPRKSPVDVMIGKIREAFERRDEIRRYLEAIMPDVKRGIVEKIGEAIRARPKNEAAPAGGGR